MMTNPHFPELLPDKTCMHIPIHILSLELLPEKISIHMLMHTNVQIYVRELLLCKILHDRC